MRESTIFRSFPWPKPAPNFLHGPFQSIFFFQFFVFFFLFRVSSTSAYTGNLCCRRSSLPDSRRICYLPPAAFCGWHSIQCLWIFRYSGSFRYTWTAGSSRSNGGRAEPRHFLVIHWRPHPQDQMEEELSTDIFLLYMGGWAQSAKC